jgi:transposase
MRKKYIVTLTDEEREDLRKLTTTGTASASVLPRARILLKTDCSGGRRGWSDTAIAAALDVSHPTIERVRKRFVEEGFEVALLSKSTGRHTPTKLDGEAEARLIALACSDPPDGHARWSLRLLAGRLIELEVVDAISHETIRRVLGKKRAQAVAG